MRTWSEGEPEPQPGIVYEYEGRYHYSCAWCSYGFSSGDDVRADQMADNHEAECTLRPGW